MPKKWAVVFSVTLREPATPAPAKDMLTLVKNLAIYLARDSISIKRCCYQLGNGILHRAKRHEVQALTQAAMTVVFPSFINA
jgi:hypothetical protein